MENFLEEGGLMHLKESLEENGIDSIDLITQLVQDKSFEETVPRLGDRLKIKRKLSLSQKTCYDEVTDQISTKKIIIDVPDIHATPSEVQSLRSTSSIDLDFTSTPIVFNITPTPVLSSIIIGDNTFHLEQLLQNSLMGRAIIELYRTNGQLSTTCQSYLVELIVQHLINIQPFRRLTNEDFRRLSKHIVELFPGELHQVYFTSPIKKRNSKDNKSGVARGKLVDKYRNRLTFLRKSGIISAKYTDKEEINTPEPNERNLEDDDFEEDLVWLIHNREPWGEVINKWSQTFEYRKQLIRQDIEFQEILQKFPIIKNPLGYTLIDIDFKRTFQPQYQLIFKKFEPIFHKLLELKKKNLNHGDLLIVDLIQSEKINVESRHYYMLTLLASLLPQKSYGKKGNIWHPTITDSVKGVIVHIKIPAEIEDTINSKRKFLSKYNLPLLPFVIIQGPSISEIENVYVVYNDIIYRCDGVLKAIDICFQIIHIFNLRYPYESENIWMFIQIAWRKLREPRPITDDLDSLELYYLLGQCGNQIGGTLWPSILQEYRILPSNHPKNIKTPITGGTDKELKFTFNSFLHIPTKINPSSLQCLNLSELQENDIKARVICIDMEDSVVSRFSNSELGFLFDKRGIVKNYPGSSNNWAEGYCTHGSTFKNKIFRIVTKYVERCDSLHGILLLYSMGGGTGSGLGSFILEQLDEQLPNIERFVCCVYPNGSEDVITAPYNAMLATQHLIRHATCVFPVENRALQEVCDIKRLAGSNPKTGYGSSIAGTFQDMNSIVVKLLLHVTRTAELRHERDQYEHGAVSEDEIFEFRSQSDRNLRRE